MNTLRIGQPASEPENRPQNVRAAPPPPELTALFPQLEIIEVIGRGGMGVVYKARQRGLQRLVALKILSPEFSSEGDFAERFAREARALARLSHPNIVTVFDLGRSGPLYYILMEYVDGPNLRQILSPRGLPVQQVLEILTGICDALDYAHDEGIVHRDIKPENILLDQKGRVKIADFGIAKLLDLKPAEIHLTQPRHVLGTMHYMAPEQWDNPAAIDGRADIYSLGVVLYEALTGDLPIGRFEMPSEKEAMDRRLDGIVSRALAHRPDARYQRPGELRMDLESIAGVSSRISPEARRKLSYEYRSKLSFFGWPLLHVTFGVDPVTGKKRNARGIIAVGTAPRGVVAFGDVAVGVIACGIFGCGIFSLSVVALGLVACGSVAAGLLFALGGLALGPVAIGGASLGWYSNGAMAWGKHALSPMLQDPGAARFFEPVTGTLMLWVFRTMIVATPVFLFFGWLPAFMARVSEWRRSKSLRRRRPEVPDSH